MLRAAARGLLRTASLAQPGVAERFAEAARAPSVYQAALAAREFRSSSAQRSDPVKTEGVEHATGLELKELDAAAKGVDYFGQDFKWLDTPFGTLENPVQVTSSLPSRIVGATDAMDDSIIHWGLVEEGKGPVQIGEEFFVLKRVKDDHH